MVEEGDEERISKFSSGINILKRLDSLWKDTHNHSREGRFQSWNDDLDRIWLELARDLDDKDYYDTDVDGNVTSNKEKIKNKGYETRFQAFDDELIKLMPFSDSGTSGFKLPTQEMNNKRNKQYKILMKKQLFLARLENKLGKGTSWGESEDDWD